MSVSDEDLPEWERLLAAERHFQSLVPGAVLVGGGRRLQSTADIVLAFMGITFCGTFAIVLTTCSPR